MAESPGQSRGRRIAGGAAAIVLALLVWWLLRPEAAETPAGRPESAEPLPAFPARPGPRPGPSGPTPPPVVQAPAPEPAPLLPPSAVVEVADDDLDFDWEVVVLDHRDRPVPGVLVRRDEKGGPVVETGSSGRARIPWPREGTPTVHLSGAAPDMSVRLDTRSTVVRLPRLLALEVVVVDGTTGLPVRGGTVALRRRSEARQALRPEGDRFVLDAPLLRTGVQESLVLEVGPPAGFASVEHRGHPVSATISRYAERVRAVVTVWPEARVLVRVTEADGTPAKGASVSHASSAGWSVPAAASTDATGSARLAGIPFVRGERVEIWAELSGRMAGSAKPALLEEPGAEVLVEITLPAKAGVASIGFGGAGGMFGGRRGGKKNLRVGDARTDLEVEVRRRDGSPAADALVVATPSGGGPFKERTGPDGTVVFKGILPAGEVVVSLEEAGLLAAPEKVVLESGRTERVVLLESEGATSAILVLDAEGRPAAGASVAVATGNGPPYVFMDGPVQVLGIRTGPDGRCTLPGLPPGTITVTATLGSRTASVETEAGQPVEITLPATP